MELNVGPIIEQYRKENKLSRRALAEKAGISQSYLTEIEREVKTPTLPIINKIADALGIKTHVLIDVESQDSLGIELDQLLAQQGIDTSKLNKDELREIAESLVGVISVMIDRNKKR